MGIQKGRTLEEARELVERLEVSGLSRPKFARLEGIPYTTLRSCEERVARIGKDNKVDASCQKKVSAPKEAFFEITPELVSGESVFTLRRGVFDLEFSLSDLPTVLSELESRA